MNIIQSNHSHRKAILSLLKDAKLPVEDLPEVLPNFFVAVENNQVIGAIGLEIYQDCGLLRSLVVKADHRGLNIATELVQRIEQHASGLRLTYIYLLTETAHSYFLKKGYHSVNRQEVPASVKASSEFTSTCPVSAIVMKKQFKHTE